MSRICSKCSNIQPCPLHQHGPYANARRSSNLYYSAEWRRIRKLQLQAQPYCRYCGAKANVADHVTPHRGDERAFWTGLLQSLCRPCSNAKTGREVAARLTARND